MILAKSYLEPGEYGNLDWAFQLAQSACRLSHWQNAECLSVLARAYQAKGERAKAQLFLERMKNLRSMLELNMSRFQSWSGQQKVSNT